MTKWHISPNVVLREESDDWGILFDADTGKSVALNPIAVSMFKAMRKTQDVVVMEKVIRDEYEEVPDTLNTDISKFVDSLAKDGFIGFEVE